MAKFRQKKKGLISHCVYYSTSFDFSIIKLFLANPSSRHAVGLDPRLHTLVMRAKRKEKTTKRGVKRQTRSVLCWGRNLTKFQHGKYDLVDLYKGFFIEKKKSPKFARFRRKNIPNRQIFNNKFR
jgi:hypothetical protein